MFNKKYERETLRAIKDLNKGLKTNLSYTYCLEEIDLLKLISNKDDASNSIKIEHVRYVLGLIRKGLVEDFGAHNTNTSRLSKFKGLFDHFVNCFLKELEHKHLIKNVAYPFDYRLDAFPYDVRFESYDNTCIKERSDNISMLIDTLNSFKLKVKKNYHADTKEELLNKYLKLDYYGPMSITNAYKKIDKNIRDYNNHIKINPFNKLKKRMFVSGYKRLVIKRDLKISANEKRYYLNQIEIEKDRLELELKRVNSLDKRYDYYFDLFLWRLNNDIEYIYLKKLGGIKKIAELINVYLKDKKAVEKGPIEVDVDNLEVIFDDNKKDGKKSGGGRKKDNPLDIKEFDKEIVYRELRKEEKERAKAIDAISRRR